MDIGYASDAYMCPMIQKYKREKYNIYNTHVTNKRIIDVLISEVKQIIMISDTDITPEIGTDI